MKRENEDDLVPAEYAIIESLINEGNVITDKPIRAGDLLYAISDVEGSVPHIYSCRVVTVTPEGSYRAEATEADYATATWVVELPADRPIRGFPRWRYRGCEVGTMIHRTSAEALIAFARKIYHQHQDAKGRLKKTTADLSWIVEQALRLEIDAARAVPGIESQSAAETLNLPVGIYEACALAFDTTREEAKRRLWGVLHGRKMCEGVKNQSTHSPVVSAEKGRIIGCACGWKPPAGGRDSEDALVAHLVLHVRSASEASSAVPQ